MIEEVCMAQVGAVRDVKEEWGGAIRFTVGGKMFAMLGQNRNGDDIVTLKCAPEKVEQYRHDFSSVVQGYYMNKTHWNSVLLQDSDVPTEVMEQMIGHSYACVVAGLPKKVRESLIL
ncbi:MmcQ/YjbR family DNA-binding protein [Shouchella lonarensis]|nr:MmcQ/YjbR family DNA-binding protein [Shouchella lonarensis]